MTTATNDETSGETARGDDKNMKWFIVHTYSGFEDRVKETLRQRAEALDMAESFGEIHILTGTIVEYLVGKEKGT